MMPTRKVLGRRCEELAKRFRGGRTGQFIMFEPYIRGEQLALGFANILSYIDNSKSVKLEIFRLMKVIETWAPYEKKVKLRK